MADPEVFDIPEEHLGLEEEAEPQFDPYKARIDHASLRRAIANQSIGEVRGDNLGKFPVTRNGVKRPEVFQIPGAHKIDDDARLGAVFEAVKDAGTDNHAKILAVAEETGLPPNVIKHQLPAWEAKMQTARFDPVKFRADYPALSGLILKNPQMAPALIKEQGMMAKLEDFLRKSPTLITNVPGAILAGAAAVLSKGNPLKGASKVGEDVELGLQHSKLTARLGTIAKKQFAQAGGKGEGPTAAELQEADEIELEMAFINAIRPDTGFLAGLPGAASEQVYRYINNAKDIGDYMAVGAAAGAAAGGIAGSAAFGVGAIPGAAGGFLGGAGWGMTAGVFATTAEEEGALFFRQLIKDGVDPKAAYAASMFLGVANGALEAAPVDKVLRMTPGAKTILTGPTKDILRKLVAKPTVSNALVRAGGRMAEGMIFEGVTEGLQEVTSTATEAYVKTGDPSAALASIWHERDKIYTATKKGAQAAGGMTLVSPFAALETVTDIKEARQAVRDQQFWEALSKGLTESDLAKNYPPAIAAMVKNARRMYGAFKEVSVPVQALSEFFSAESLTPEQIAEKLPDVARQMNNADPSAEVTIKTEDFITHFVPSAGFKALQPDIRVGNRPTAREAPDVEKGAEEILKEVAKHEEEKTAGGETPLRRGLEVYEAVRNTLVGLDVTPEVASTDAALWQSFVNARASRLGKDPTEYFKGLNIQFVREPGTIKMSLKDKGDIASLYQKDDPRLTPHQRELHALIETAGTPAERAAALDELVESLMRDELTGADTQNAWQRFAPKDAFGNYINPKPGWYLAIDVNDLKRVNDVIGGHGGGDALLSALGRAIGPGVRSRRGKFFRSGGDEFMGHFQTRAQAESALKEINKAVNALPFMFNGAFKPSISAGLAMDPTRADQAMFKAKEQARANGRSGFGREGASDVVNLDAGDVFAEIDASLNEEETETLFQKDGANGEVISAVPKEQLSDASTYAAFRLPDGRVAITGAVHDIAGLPEAVRTEFFSDPNWYENASRSLKEGALVHGRATKSGRFWATEDIENALGQMGDSGARGMFQYSKARDWMKITLSGRANLSTFLHESGHAFMAILERDAMTDEQSASELQTIKNWLGVTGKKQITRAQYEQFAQGFEAYLREGKAPSTALAQAFESFKAWLRNIYASIVQLGNVQLDDEIRGVMDRLLATDMEIKEAQEKLGVVPLEDSAKLMPEEEYAEYRLRFTEAVEAAQAAADRASIREFHRTVSDERRMLEREVEKAGREHPVHNARELILNGKRLSGSISEGALMMAGRKLDSTTLADLPLDRAQRARLRQLTEKGGMDPNFAAAALGGKDAGFATGKDLLMALADMPSLERWVKQETDKRMSEKYPGYKNNRQWNQENVHRALHVDQIGNAIWAGMVAMTKKLGGKQGKSAKQAIKAGAERRVGEKTILEMKPHLSMRNEAKAAREAAEAWKAGDVRLAYEATRRQLFYHFEWRAMDKARTEVKKITDYFGSFKDVKKRIKLGKGNFELLEAIDAILSQVEYGETLERGADLSGVVKKLREQGYPVALPADFNYKILEGDYEAMTLDGIHAVRDVVQNFEHIALSEYEEKTEANKLHFQSLTQQIASHIRVNMGKELPAEAPNAEGLVQLVPTRWEAFKAKVRSIPWSLKKFEYLARIADGGQTAGFFHLHAFQPVADAEAYEHTLMRDVFTKLRNEFKRLPFMERMKHDKQVEFLGGRLPHRDVLMIAGHMRNQGNIDRLVRNHGWDPEKIVARLDEVMTDEDIETINNIGRLMESLWPKVVEVYKRVYGVEPKKVEGNDIILPKTGRVIEGGYFPILRDPKDPYHADAAAGELWDKDFVSMMVGHGFTEERSKTADTRLSLSLDALPAHIVKVIHFISHFEATHKVDRLLKDPGVRSAIEDGLSPEAYAEMGPWLKNIVHGGDVGTEVVGGGDWFLRHTRVGATVVLLGARMSTAVIQGMGLTMTMKELSTQNGKASIVSPSAARYMALGTWQFMRDTSEWIRNGFRGPGPFQMIEAVSDDWILHRENYERDLRLEYKRLTSAFSEFGHARKRLAEFSMALFNLVQGTVNAISWHAALRKAQEEGHARPDDYANAVIRMGQSAGGPKDLSGIQRGSEFKKWITVLYSFANIVFNSTTEQSPKHLSAPEKISNRAAQLWWVVLAPAVIAILLKGDDDDFDDPESFMKAVGVESAMFWARGIPLVGDAVRAARGYDPKQAPWLEFMAAGAKTLGKATGFNEDDAEITDRDVRALINMLGTLGHIPTQAGMNLIDYYEQFPMMEDKLLNAAARTPKQYK